MMLSEASCCRTLLIVCSSFARIQVSRPEYFRTAVCLGLRIWLCIYLNNDNNINKNNQITWVDHFRIKIILMLKNAFFYLKKIW